MHINEHGVNVTPRQFQPLNVKPGHLSYSFYRVRKMYVKICGRESVLSSAVFVHQVSVEVKQTVW